MKYGIWVDEALWYNKDITGDEKSILIDISLQRLYEATEKQLENLINNGYLDNHNQLTEKTKKLIEVK